MARAAQLMVARHIHRLVAVDDEDAPIGVVSSLDYPDFKGSTGAS